MITVPHINCRCVSVHFVALSDAALSSLIANQEALVLHLKESLDAIDQDDAEMIAAFRARYFAACAKFSDLTAQQRARANPFA